MAFGKKSAEIKRLRADLRAAEAELETVRPYIPAAKAVEAEVDAFIGSGGIPLAAFREACNAVSTERKIEVAMSILPLLTHGGKIEVAKAIMSDEEIHEGMRVSIQQEPDAVVVPGYDQA